MTLPLAHRRRGRFSPVLTLVGTIAAGRSGVSRYAAALIEAIDREVGGGRDIRVQLMAHPPALERIDVQNLELADSRLLRRAHAREGPRRVAAEQAAVVGAQPGLLYFFDLIPPILAPRRKFIATVHDAAIAHSFGPQRTAHKSLLQPAAVHLAYRLIAVSSFARDEAITHFGASAHRTTVVHSGPGLVARSKDESAGQIDVSRPYILFVGNLLPHKNLTTLLDGFELAEIDADLMIVGSWGTERPVLEERIRLSPKGERIRLLHNVSDSVLEVLYRRATALALPSVYEGFGFTALEAMGRGCPVLASRIPSLQEVCRDGAKYVMPRDPDAWRRAIEEIVTDAKHRKDLIERGHQVVETYSWSRTAREVLSVCEAALEQRA